MKQTVKLSVVALGLTTAISSGWLLAQEPDPPVTPPTDEEIREGQYKAELIAKLVKYGRKKHDPLALVSAAAVLQTMSSGVVKPGAAHDVASDSHDTGDMFTVDEILDDAREASVGSQNADAIGKIIKTIEQTGTKSYQGWLHWHYVWWTDEWGRVYWRWFSHY